MYYGYSFPVISRKHSFKQIPWSSDSYTLSISCFLVLPECRSCVVDVPIGAGLSAIIGYAL